jgi:hypothetical protein
MVSGPWSVVGGPGLVGEGWHCWWRRRAVEYGSELGRGDGWLRLENCKMQIANWKMKIGKGVSAVESKKSGVVGGWHPIENASWKWIQKVGSF